MQINGHYIEKSMFLLFLLKMNNLNVFINEININE